MNEIKTDILIIGSGAAGLTAGVYAAQLHKKVLVIDKGAVGKSGSTVGAVQMAGLGEWSNPLDDERAYMRDIENSGRGLSDPALAKTLVNDISKRIEDLTSWGLKLDRDKSDQAAVYPTAGHSLPRSISARKGKTGLGILQTLIRKAKTLSENLHTWSDVITLDLVKSSTRVIGAVVFDLKKNKPYVIKAKAVILATGGIGQLYPTTSNPVQSTGDGYSLGLGAGASLIDMEQVQFYPVSLVTPRSVAGLCISFYHYSNLYNTFGERFMETYEPETLENTTRDKLSIAIASEVVAGRGSDHGGVWLDISSQLEKVKKEFLHEFNICMDRGIDLTHGYAEVGPAAHFMMGGVHIDVNTASSVPGLYVAGETAGGLHGGNRLGNNALTECLVFGAKAGINAAWESNNYEDQSTVTAEALSPFATKLLDTMSRSVSGSVKSYQIKQRIQEILGTHVAVLRTDEGLKQAAKQLEAVDDLLDQVEMSTEVNYSRELIDYVEGAHMLRTAKAIVGAALHRKESRGAHFNSDHPSPASNIYHTFVTKENEQVVIHTSPKGEK
ncbi:FAD-binding protein [Desertibacillus haloalkaliphilus]|uniref:FAD-binding protein n=1 Tax=Desertibacillus haloalkaliphilus TaxID=1328930 RepID=UPI001C2778E6|nr:FAD-binding protein [Desertibacillus haloalkaliphilus]MBU8906027.1 FAD-binding protein [Desertibacillus haloalkaliphilus]